MKRHSKLAILALLAVSVLSLGMLAQAQEAQDGKPKATVPVPVKDFGKVDRGTKLSYDFEIKNAGTAPLELTRVDPDCGCTVAKFDRVIPPGETGKVHADVDTTTLTGPVSRKIAVFTNDPANPRLELTFLVHSTPRLQVKPGYARYQAVHGEEVPGIIRQLLYAPDGERFEVTGVDSPWPYLTTSVREATAEEREGETSGKQWIVEMNFDYNRAPVGPLAQELVIHTTHPTQERVVIPVSGFVRPTMWVTPHEVDLGRLDLEQPRNLSLVLQNFLAAPVEVTGVSSDWGDALTAEVLPIEEGRRYSVQVTVTPDMPKGPFDGSLKIRTSTPKMPVVEVPIKGTVL